MNTLRSLWRRISSLWAPLPCERCGAPAVGYRMELVGAIPCGTGTKMYVRGCVRVCRSCMESK